MASSIKISVNGLTHSVSASLDTPLLYVLHNELHLHGPRFGCGLAQCGACSVLLNGKEIRSCVTPVAAVAGQKITTLEGLPALWAKQSGQSAAAPNLQDLRSIFSRFIDERQQASGGAPLTPEQKNELFGQFELWQKGQVR